LFFKFFDNYFFQNRLCTVSASPLLYFTVKLRNSFVLDCAQEKMQKLTHNNEVFNGIWEIKKCIGKGILFLLAICEQ
jgi:hypothetical protein